MVMAQVLVRHSFDVWETWSADYATKDHIEFYYNEGTSCADNILHQLLALRKQRGPHGCLCYIQSSEVVEIQS